MSAILTARVPWDKDHHMWLDVGDDDTYLVWCSMYYYGCEFAMAVPQADFPGRRGRGDADWRNVLRIELGPTFRSSEHGAGAGLGGFVINPEP